RFDLLDNSVLIFNIVYIYRITGGLSKRIVVAESLLVHLLVIQATEIILAELLPGLIRRYVLHTCNTLQIFNLRADGIDGCLIQPVIKHDGYAHILLHGLNDIAKVNHNGKKQSE